MLRKPFHGWRIKQEIQKLTAIRASSPNLNPVRESPGSPTRPTPLTPLSPPPPLFSYCQNLPHRSHFRFACQSLSTSSLATGPFSASYYSGAPEPEPEPNTHLEDPNLNVESLRESSDDRRENGGDGEAFCRGRMLPEERVLILCVVEDGKCRVYCFWTKLNSQELSRKEAMVVTYVGPNKAAVEALPCDMGSIERLKQSRKVLNKLEVYPGNVCHVAMEEIMKYGGKVMPLPKQVANKLEVYLRRWFRVAYEEAIKYGVQVMMRPFALQATTWEKCPRDPLESLLKPEVYPSSPAFTNLREYVAKLRRLEQVSPSRFSKVADKLEVYLGHRFRVEFEVAMEYGVGVMMKCHFPVQVALCDRRPLREKIAFVRESLMYNKFYCWDDCSDEQFSQTRFSRLWRFCVLLLLQWVRSATYFGRKK